MSFWPYVFILMCIYSGGEYPQYRRQTPQDEEEDEVELDSEESESF